MLFGLVKDDWYDQIFNISFFYFVLGFRVRIFENPNYQIEDRQNEYIFTIDPQNSQDFDDGFSIVDLPNNDENLRNELQIPQDAIVFGRYGGMDDFNINIAKNAIKNYINLDTNVYFLFMN